jgi:hypothetical protein
MMARDSVASAMVLMNAMILARMDKSAKRMCDPVG